MSKAVELQTKEAEALERLNTRAQTTFKKLGGRGNWQAIAEQAAAKIAANNSSIAGLTTQEQWAHELAYRVAAQSTIETRQIYHPDPLS